MCERGRTTCEMCAMPILPGEARFAGMIFTGYRTVLHSCLSLTTFTWKQDKREPLFKEGVACNQCKHVTGFFPETPLLSSKQSIIPTTPAKPMPAAAHVSTRRQQLTKSVFGRRA